jgi:hypothetical protein
MRIFAEASERAHIVYWPLFRFPLIVGERDANESPPARGLLHSDGCFIHGKHTGVLCVGTIGIIQYVD